MVQHSLLDYCSLDQLIFVKKFILKEILGVKVEMSKNKSLFIIKPCEKIH